MVFRVQAIVASFETSALDRLESGQILTFHPCITMLNIGMNKNQATRSTKQQIIPSFPLANCNEHDEGSIRVTKG